MRAESVHEEGVAAGIEGRTEGGEGRSDLGVVRDVDDVGRDEQAQPDAQACAVGGGEGRRGERGDATHQRGDETVEKPRHVVGGGIHVGDVATRAERAARSAQQHRAGAVLLRPGVRRVELAQGLRVERIELVGAVQCDRREPGGGVCVIRPGRGLAAHDLEGVRDHSTPQTS